jgi:hypothetical protein
LLTFGYTSGSKGWREMSTQGSTGSYTGTDRHPISGRYHYDVKKLLDTIPAIRYEDGNFLILSNKKRKITEFLEKNNASYRM